MVRARAKDTEGNRGWLRVWERTGERARDQETAGESE